MKGAIVNCLKEMVVYKYGQQEWEKIMIASGLQPNKIIMATSDFDDAQVVGMVQNSCTVLNQTLEQVADHFGEFWMNSYAVGVYKPYFGTTSTAKEFMIKLNDIHTKVTKNIPNARPPQFEYDWKEDNVLILTYISQRGLIDFVVGLAKGVGIYFNQKLSVRKISSTKLEIIFL
jgi:hypothetical protein